MKLPNGKSKDSWEAQYLLDWEQEKLRKKKIDEMEFMWNGYVSPPVPKEVQDRYDEEYRIKWRDKWLWKKFWSRKNHPVRHRVRTPF